MIGIFGAGGLGREVLEIILRINPLEKVLFLDDFKTGKILDKKLENISNINPEDINISIALGEPSIREKKYKELKKKKFNFMNIIDPSVIISRYHSFGVGITISPNVTISNNAKIFDNVYINNISIVGHDVEIGENSVISSMVNLGGAVKIGSSSYIGMGSMIKENVSIGNNCIVGMGSVVYSDIPDNIIAIGNPARPIKKNIDKKVFK